MKDFMKEMEKEAEIYKKEIKQCRRDLMISVEIYPAFHSRNNAIFKLDGARLPKGLSMLNKYLNNKFDMDLEKKKKRK